MVKLLRRRQLWFGSKILLPNQCVPWRAPNLRVVEYRAVIHDDFLVVNSEDPAHQRMLPGVSDPEGLDQLLSLGGIGGITVIKPPEGLFPWWQSPKEYLTVPAWWVDRIENPLRVCEWNAQNPNWAPTVGGELRIFQDAPKRRDGIKMHDPSTNTMRYVVPTELPICGMPGWASHPFVHSEVMLERLQAAAGKSVRADGELYAGRGDSSAQSASICCEVEIPPALFRQGTLEQLWQFTEPAWPVILHAMMHGEL